MGSIRLPLLPSLIKGRQAWVHWQIDGCVPGTQNNCTCTFAELRFYPSHIAKLATLTVPLSEGSQRALHRERTIPRVRVQRLRRSRERRSGLLWFCSDGQAFPRAQPKRPSGITHHTPPLWPSEQDFNPEPQGCVCVCLAEIYLLCPDI